MLAEGQNMEIRVNTDYGNLRLGWDETAGADSYLVTMLDGDGNELTSYRESYGGSDALPHLAYYCQENGYPAAVSFRVQAMQEEQVLAEGRTDPLNPRDFFPEQEQLAWDEDVDPALVTKFSWDTSGDTVEANNHISVYRSDGSITLSADYYDSSSKHHRTEKKVSESDWNELLELLRQGTIARKYIADPEMIVLDGGEERMTLRWEGMSDTQERFYVFRAGGHKDALMAWLYGRAGKNSAAGWLIGGAAALLGAAGFAVSRKKKK